MAIEVSAIVSTYKSQKYMQGLMEDLVKQTLYKQGKMEIVVVDSASPEDEFSIIRQFQKEFANIVYHRTAERETLSGAWNTGIRISKGRYISNANADDRHREDMFEYLYKFLEENSNIDLAYGEVYESREPNQTFENNPRTKRYNYKEYFQPDVYFHYQFGNQPMWRKSVHDVIGGFDASYKSAGDYEFNFRFALSPQLKAKYLPEVLGTFLESETALSKQDTTSAREVKQLKLKYFTTSNMFKMYENAGFGTSSLEDKKRVLRELKDRASSFTVPWILDEKFVDAEIATYAATYLTLLEQRGENVRVELVVNDESQK